MFMPSEGCCHSCLDEREMGELNVPDQVNSAYRSLKLLASVSWRGLELKFRRQGCSTLDGGISSWCLRFELYASRLACRQIWLALERSSHIACL